MRPLAALRTAVATLCRLVTRTEPPVRLVPSWEQDTVPLPGPDPVDVHAAQAMALLAPDDDDLPPADCDCEDCADLPEAPAWAVRELLAEAYTILRRHSPPDPPIMPGRPS